MRGAAGLVRVSDWAHLHKEWELVRLLLKGELVNERSSWARQSERLGSSS